MENATDTFKSELTRIIAKQGLSNYKTMLCCDLPCGNTLAYVKKSGNPHLKNLIKFSKGLNIKIVIENGELQIIENGR